MAIGSSLNPPSALDQSTAVGTLGSPTGFGAPTGLNPIGPEQTFSTPDQAGLAGTAASTGLVTPPVVGEAFEVPGTVIPTSFASPALSTSTSPVAGSVPASSISPVATTLSAPPSTLSPTESSLGAQPTVSPVTPPVGPPAASLAAEHAAAASPASAETTGTASSTESVSITDPSQLLSLFHGLPTGSESTGMLG